MEDNMINWTKELEIEIFIFWGSNDNFGDVPAAG